MASFELDRRSIAGRSVSPLGVIEHLDVVEDIDACVVARGIDLAAHSLTLEQLKEALGDGVVVAVSAPAHAAGQIVFPHERLPAMSGELTSLIRVHRDSLLRPTAP
ncbi:hypothetical protein D9M68_968430 [compost metagenome]